MIPAILVGHLNWVYIYGPYCAGALVPCSLVFVLPAQAPGTAIIVTCIATQYVKKRFSLHRALSGLLYRLCKYVVIQVNDGLVWQRKDMALVQHLHGEGKVVRVLN